MDAAESLFGCLEQVADSELTRPACFSQAS